MTAGLYPILHTPFDATGTTDLTSFRRLVRHVRESEVEGVVFPGFASEWWRLTDTEILACAAAIEGPFVGVVTPQATVPAVSLAREFERMGATGLMLLPPFLLSGPPVPHLSALLKATSLPCILQDSAGLTGARLDASSVAALAAEHNNLIGVKVDQVPTGPAITAFRKHAALNGLTYFAGYSGIQWPDAARRGATALMSGCGHIAADRRMLQDEAEYRRLLPLLNFEMQTLDMVIAVHKRLLFDAGVIATPDLRSPANILDDIQIEQLRQLANDLGGEV
jgi:4-hydroxy-tetrahydrodipicolinate synthase